MFPSPQSIIKFPDPAAGNVTVRFGPRPGSKYAVNGIGGVLVVIDTPPLNVTPPLIYMVMIVSYIKGRCPIAVAFASKK
jgi:hypothetical protein